jgi:hypothetical protein
MLLHQVQPPTRLKLAASVLLAVPIALLLLFTIGEMTGGDLSGAQHIVQVAPLLLLLIAGWRYPRLAGIALLGLGVLLLVIWLVFVVVEGERGEIVMWVGAGLLLFVLPLTAGWLFLKAGRTATRA